VRHKVADFDWDLALARGGDSGAGWLPERAGNMQMPLLFAHLCKHLWRDPVGVGSWAHGF